MVGIGIAIGRWRQHPRVSLMTLIGLAIIAVVALANALLAAFLPLLMREFEWSTAQLGVAFAGFSLIASIIGAIAWTLILTALFSGREARLPAV